MGSSPGPIRSLYTALISLSFFCSWKNFGLKFLLLKCSFDKKSVHLIVSIGFIFLALIQCIFLLTLHFIQAPLQDRTKVC